MLDNWSPAISNSNKVRKENKEHAKLEETQSI